MSHWTDAGVPGETPIDPSGLKRKGITTRAELSAAEAENIRKALVKYLSSRPSKKRAPFDFAWCLRLHREMFGDVWHWAGKIRNCELNIGVPSYAISENLAALVIDLPLWSEFCDFVEQAARLHYRAVQIHPFENGNGRWARLLANIWLRLHDQPVVEWPEEVIGFSSVIRVEYLASIQQADAGDLEPFIQLHRRYLASSQSE